MWTLYIILTIIHFGLWSLKFKDRVTIEELSKDGKYESVGILLFWIMFIWIVSTVFIIIKYLP